MRLARYAVLVALLVAVPAAAKRRVVGEPFHLHPAPPVDVFSAAQPSEARTYHLSLDLVLDFERQQIRGSATHSILNLTGGSKFVVDTRDLEITGVTIDGQPATWSLGAALKAGRALSIDIQPATHFVRIDYATPPDTPYSVTGAARWLTPRQTLGAAAPFFFTFSQPDKARGWIPVQDTPGVKMTYDARITVPDGLLAIMSARNNLPAPSPDGVHTFWMERPVPAYLIALAVGRLELHPLDERTGFYAEPELVEDGLWELQYVPGMLDAAERILGPYPFARYDLLLVPPSFSAGGMENPMLNFYNAHSLVDGNRESPPLPRGIVAHEMAHSWAGDMVTCGTWSDTWLNEGFATYYDKRIMEAMGQGEWAEYAFFADRDFYEDFALQQPAATTTLHRLFKASDNLSIFNGTNYQKGSLFLKTIEDLAGRPAFDAFIREYFERHANRWADSAAFVATLRDTLVREWPQLEAQLRVDQWVYQGGLPSNVTAPTTSALQNRIAAQAAAFRAGTPASALQTSGWTSRDVILFLPMIGNVMDARMAELDAAFGLSFLKTPPTYWLVAVARTKYAPGMPAIERFLASGGWNVAAIYSALAQSGSKAYALEMYGRLRDIYGPDLQAYLDQLLGVSAPAALRDAA